MIGILDIPQPARELLMNIACGGRGQLQWYPHPLPKWYEGDPNSVWSEYIGRPVWVWRSPDGNLGAPISLPTLVCLRVLQGENLVTRESELSRGIQPVMLTADGKRIVNWLAWDGWMPRD